ncbi:MAG: hypothetical protein INQ03_25535 [Candidatus Heimdallarchaeota archaeon]|nr:hypothetical protein [Candidatus Heimdallarchaeota archaeon]
MSDQSRSPIIGIYILDKSGIPLLARHYFETMAENEAILLGGFFSAIETYARTSLKSSLMDIGIDKKRFYFGKSASGYIFVLLMGTEDNYSVQEELVLLVKLLQNRINLLLNVVEQLAMENMVYYESIIKNMGSSLDSIIFESTFEQLDDDVEIFIPTGAEINTDDIDKDLINKLKDLLD